MSTAPNTDQRIAQFQKMATDDPNNELAHFSLGKVFAEAGDHRAAVDSYRRALALNQNISKVYQLLAQSLLKMGEEPAAIGALTAGVEVADRRGDLLPKNEMIAQLKELGAAVPELKSGGATTGAAPAPAVGEGQVLCKRCGRAGPKLAKPPFKSAFGQEIFQGTCAACWREAIGMGTKVINELRLPMNDPQAQKVWDQHIREFLNL
jgi:Fe-S cluster biosynthesis and repair protein YggX